jgi:hypothetical protein
MKRIPGIETPLTEQANPASASIDALPTEDMLRIVIEKCHNSGLGVGRVFNVKCGSFAGCLLVHTAGSPP